jgi:NAD(P)H-flavin reductase
MAAARSGLSTAARRGCSSRSWDDVIYRDELGGRSGGFLDGPPDGLAVIHTLTREQPPGWTGYARRLDQAMLAEVAWPAAQTPLAPLAYACGPTSFVETVAAGLLRLGYPAGADQDRAVRGYRVVSQVAELAVYLPGPAGKRPALRHRPHPHDPPRYTSCKTTKIVIADSYTPHQGCNYP